MAESSTAGCLPNMTDLFSRLEAPFPAEAVISVALDRSGRIIFVNEGWKRFAASNDCKLRDFGLGENYLRHCAYAEPESARIVDGIVRLLNRSLDCVSYVYPCHSPQERRWFAMLGFAVAGDYPAAVLLHLNISNLIPTAGEGADPAVLSDMFGGARAAAGVAAAARQSFHNGGAAVETTVGPTGSRVPDLSRRERQVLELTRQGLSLSDIAGALGISPNTVKVYVSGLVKSGALRRK